ncbi:hypothetical protein ACWCO0_19535, partial [Streptomyces tubercidicus]
MRPAPRTAQCPAPDPLWCNPLTIEPRSRRRPYRLPAGSVMAPLGFVFANLIFYWSGYEAD